MVCTPGTVPSNTEVSLIRPNRASSWNISRMGLGVAKLFTI
jgi:hypothetical protein